VKITSGLQDSTIALGGGGFGVALSPDNVQLYVTFPASHVVKVIDRATRAIVKTIQTNGTPRRLAFSVAGETAVIANEAGWVDCALTGRIGRTERGAQRRRPIDLVISLS
jgi:YVTN family beta-propeller protein